MLRCREEAGRSRRGSSLARWRGVFSLPTRLPCWVPSEDVYLVNRTEKEALVVHLQALFAQSSIGLLVDYQGLSVGALTELRTALQAHEARVKVLKNRLAKRAIAETPYAPLAEHLTGPRALVHSQGDPVQVAKTVFEALEKLEKLDYVHGAFVSGSKIELVDQARLETLSRLPAREVLQAQLLGLMQSVPTQFVRTLNEVPTRFVRALADLQQKRAA